jgi:transcription elongation factor GreA
VASVTRFDPWQRREVQSGVPRCQPGVNRRSNGGPAGAAYARISGGSGTGRTNQSKDIVVEKDVILTQNGFEKLKATIEELETVKRREVADRIKAAREFGDISENSEYDDAKNEQALLENRIARLKEQLRAARVIDTSDIPKDIVSIGSKVKVKYVDGGDTDEYEIVGSAEADPANNRLSNESPVGKAVLGHKKGDVVDVAAPSGSIKLQIMSIKAA